MVASHGSLQKYYVSERLILVPNLPVIMTVMNVQRGFKYEVIDHGVFFVTVSDVGGVIADDHLDYM